MPGHLTQELLSVTNTAFSVSQLISLKFAYD